MSAAHQAQGDREKRNHVNGAKSPEELKKLNEMTKLTKSEMQSADESVP